MHVSITARRRSRLFALAVGAIPLSLCSRASAGSYWNDTGTFSWINTTNWGVNSSSGTLSPRDAVHSGQSAAQSSYKSVLASFNKSPSNLVPGSSLRMASPALSPNLASDLTLEVNLSTGDVYLQAATATAFTGYDIFDNSGNLLDSGDPNTDLNELLLSQSTKSSQGNTTTYRNATNYKLWHISLDSGSNLAEAQNYSKLLPGTASSYDTINIPAGGTIDFGDIYNTTINNQDLNFSFLEADPTNGGNPVTGAVYGGEVNYLNGAPNAPLYWKNSAATGNWSNSNNWSAASPNGTDNGGSPGGNFDQALITNADALNHVITLDENAAISYRLQIGNTGGGTDTLSQSGAFNISTPTEQVGVGAGGVGVHNQSAGINTYSSALVVGSDANSTGTYNLSGSGSININGTETWVASPGMYVGYNGSGNFNQSAGSVTLGGVFNPLPNSQGIPNVNLYIGFASGGVGTYALSGTGSLTVYGNVFVGGSSAAQGGTGNLTISGGSMLVSNGLVSNGVTVYPGSTVTQSGGTLTANQLTVNSGGTFAFTGGTLNINSASVNTSAPLAVGDGTNQAFLNLAGRSGGGNATYTFPQGLSVNTNSTLAGGGTITNAGGNAPVTVYGTLSPTAVLDSNYSIQINGSLTLEPSAAFLTQRVGSTPSFGSITATGNITLGGALDIYEDAANESKTSSNQGFAILSTTSGTLGGTFTDVASGGRLETEDRSGSFLVTVNSGADGDVVISDFVAGPFAYYWKNSVVAGNWSNGNNWSTISPSGTDNAGAPGNAIDFAEITNTDALNHVITLDQSALIQSLQIGNTGGGTDTFSQTSRLYSINVNTEEVGVGSAGIGVYSQSAATNSVEDALIVGADQGSVGTYNLSGTGSINLVAIQGTTQGMYIGYNGQGTFNQSAGSVSLSIFPGANLYVGYSSNSAGTYLLSGGSVSVANSAYVGYSGNGTFNQSGGSVAFAPNAAGSNLYLGYNGTGVGTGLLSAGTLTFSEGSEYVGYSGNGSFNQSGGSVTFQGIGNLYLGYNSTGIGTYVLSGSATSTLAPDAGNEYVGYNGTGTFTQSGGYNHPFYLFVGSSGPGIYSLSGGTLSAFYETIGDGGSGTFNQSGGTNTCYGGLVIGASGQGSYLLSGNGSLQSGASVGSSTNSGGVGTFAISGGTVSGELSVYSGSTLTQTGGTLGGGAEISSGATYSMSGGTLDSGIRVDAGGSFTMNGGTLNVSEANINTGSTFVVGDGSTAATLNMSGSGAFTFAQGLSISTAATLTGGGTITNASTSVPVAVSGVIAPLAAQKSIAINGSLTLESSATSLIQRIGFTPSFGTVTSTGNMALAGVLTLSQDTVNQAATTPAQSFVILSTTSGTLSGGFSDVTSGQRLSTTDGLGSFIVTVNDGPDGDVVLSGFQLTDTDYWKDGISNGNWSGSNNWSATASSGQDNSGPPDANANVYITHADAVSRVATLDENVAIQTLQIGNTGGGTDTLSQTSAFNLTMNSEQVGIGTGAVGVHTQSAGTNTYSNALIVGASSGSSGTYNLSGTGNVNISASTTGALGMCVGENGSGTFNQSGGSVTVGGAANANLYLGYNGGGTGTYALSGSGALTVNGSVYLGGSSTALGGTGTLNISGGSMSISNSLNIFSGSSVTQSGGTLTAGNISVYYNGAFTLNGGTLNIGSAGFNNTTFAVGNASSAATLNLIPSSPSATFTFPQGLSVSPLATLSGGGLIVNGSGLNAQVSVYGTIAPAAQSSLTVVGSLTLQSSATTLFQRVGPTISFGSVQTNEGTLTLAGVLAVYEDAVNEAVTTSSQSFIVIEAYSGGTLSGAFSNIASGQTLTTTDGTANFLVTINEGTNGDVILSDFQPVPEPSSLALLGLGAFGLLSRRRRGKHAMAQTSRGRLT